MDDGPGVSINRYGGLSSPTCCVMVFVLLYSRPGMPELPVAAFLREHSVAQRKLRFSRNAPDAATDKLAATASPQPSFSRALLDLQPAPSDKEQCHHCGHIN